MPRASATFPPMHEIRAARRPELPAIYDLLDVAFGDAPRRLFVDQTEGDSTFRLRDARIAVEDGKVLAHVRVFRRRMTLRGTRVRAGGIGSVASAPEARGRGLPTHLLRDAVAEMRRDGVALSFLFTGIPAFYERLGWRIVHEPHFVARADELAALPVDVAYRVRRVGPDDAAAMLAVYRRAIAGSTGAVVRTERTWRDARSWLGEDSKGCLVASDGTRMVAYVRARSRDYGYNLLEAEHVPGHAPALAPLLRRAGARARELRQDVVASAPDDSTLAAMLGSLPSTEESGMRGLPRPVVGYPTMVRIVSLDATVGALLPVLAAGAAANPGPPITFELHAHDNQRRTVAIGRRSARISRRPADVTFDADATLEVILGQRQPSDIVRRSRIDPAALARLDALLPEATLHFWNSDRI